MQGRDFAPLYLAAQKPAWRTEFFYEHATIQNTNFIPVLARRSCARTGNISYWPDFKPEQLFDLAADPLEENDLAADPAQAKRLAEMRAASPNSRPPPGRTSTR